MKLRQVGPLGLLLLLGFGAEGWAQNWRTDEVSRRLGAEEALDVRVEYAVGRFRLTELSGDHLYRLRSEYDAQAFDLQSSYRSRDGRGRLRVELEGIDDEDRDIEDYDVEAGSLDLALSDAVPVALQLKFGAAEADIDLGGLRLTEMDLATGASETEIRFSQKNTEVAERCKLQVGAASIRVESIGNSGCRAFTFEGGVGDVTLDFSGDWGYDAKAEIKVGLGSVEIHVPAELGVRIERKTFLMTFDAPEFWKGEDAWVSHNWSEAESRLELSVKGALGSIEVNRI